MKFLVEPYFDYTFFDVWKFRDVIQFAVAIALGFAGTYTLTNVWVIADYTDPKITDKWKLRYHRADPDLFATQRRRCQPEQAS